MSQSRSADALPAGPRAAPSGTLGSPSAAPGFPAEAFADPADPADPAEPPGFPAETLAAQRTAVPALARWNRRIACQLIALVAIPALLALALTGLWVTDATRRADAYGQAGRLAALGQQVAGLAQAMADERSGAAAFVSRGRPAAGLTALHRLYGITDNRAARVRRLVSRLGRGYPAQARAGAAQVLASIAKLAGLRGQTSGQASAPAVITGYSAATAGLFPVTDGIADQTGNPTLIASVRALSALTRMIDHAAQQRAILGVALDRGRFGPGALAALTTAQARQASDLASFRGSATPEESWALAATLARPPATRAQAVEQRAIAAGNGPLALGPQASRQWSAGMAYTAGWMGNAERQLAAWIPADARALQRSATRSATITGGAGLTALVLVLLGAILAARSMVRRLRRLEATGLGLEAAGPEGAEAGPPAGASDVSAGFLWRNHSLLERMLRLIDSLELHEEDPERLADLFEMDHLATRVWRNSDSALVLAGHQTPRPAGPLALVDVLRAAASEIEEYSRVILDAQPGVRVTGDGATDAVHLLAELLENATRFSPETAQVIVSGHAVCGGGALVTITDGGTGMPEEELALLNWRLANPSLADMAAAPHMGLFVVALLAARHGVTVTLSMPPDGGVTAEVYLPAALISLDAEPGSWRGRGGEAAFAGTGEAAFARAGEAALTPADEAALPWAEDASLTRAGEARARAGQAFPPPAPAPASQEAGAAVADLPFSALRFTSRPQHPRDPEMDAAEAVPLMLGAPLPAPAPPASTEVAGSAPGNGLPIFESVRSGYPQAFGRGLLGFSGQQTGQPPVGWPVRPPASWGDSNGDAVAAPPAADDQASWLPRRSPQSGLVRGTAADQETWQAPVAEPAEVTRSKLASFQRGSRRARSAAQMNHSASHQPGQDG